MREEIFSALPNRAINTRQIHAGGYVFRQFDAVKALYILQSGAVEMRRIDAEGRVVVMHHAKPGESFAEASIFSDHYHCDAICREDTQLLEIYKPAILRHLRNDPEFAMRMMAEFAQHIQHQRQRFQIMSIKSAKERVLSSFYAGWEFDEITDLASAIDLTREATYRALAALVKEGKLTKTSRGCYALV